MTDFMAGVAARQLVRGLSLMWVESIVLVSVTFAFTTYFSTLTTGMLALGLHDLAFLGDWIEQFGAITQTQRAATVGVIASVLPPREALWHRAASEMQFPLASAMRISPFNTLSERSAIWTLNAKDWGNISIENLLNNLSFLRK
jgi:hypothetical protein